MVIRTFFWYIKMSTLISNPRIYSLRLCQKKVNTALWAVKNHQYILAQNYQASDSVRSINPKVR